MCLLAETKIITLVAEKLWKERRLSFVKTTAKKNTIPHRCKIIMKGTLLGFHSSCMLVLFFASHWEWQDFAYFRRYFYSYDKYLLKM